MNQLNKPNTLKNEDAIKKTFYHVKEIAQILSVSERTAYNFCKETKEFKVIVIGRLIRINKESFDNWLLG